MNLQKLINSLNDKGYEVSCFATSEEAADYLSHKINGKTVGFGDSETLNKLNLYELLSDNNQVIDPQHTDPDMDFLSTARCCLTTDVFFTSVNALAETGEIVNIDGTGNRVAGSLFGHEKVYFVVGRNKVTTDLEKAIWRASNVAAPKNAARHEFKTPCAVKGDRCYDCKSPDRICCAQVIHYQKMRFIDMEVVLIEEDLGL